MIAASSLIHLAAVALSLAVTAFVCTAVSAAMFIHLKLWIPTQIPRRDITLADKITSLEQIENQQPNTGHLKLAESDEDDMTERWMCD